MNKILQDERSKKTIEIYENYHKKLVKLSETKKEKLSAIEMMINIKSVGWQSFEDGQSLEDNPFMEGLNDDFNWWQEGWMQAREEINLSVKNHLEHGFSLV